MCETDLALAALYSDNALVRHAAVTTKPSSSIARVALLLLVLGCEGTDDDAAQPATQTTGGTAPVATAGNAGTSQDGAAGNQQIDPGSAGTSPAAQGGAPASQGGVSNGGGANGGTANGGTANGGSAPCTPMGPPPAQGCPEQGGVGVPCTGNNLLCEYFVPGVCHYTPGPSYRCCNCWMQEASEPCDAVDASAPTCGFGGAATF